MIEIVRDTELTRAYGCVAEFRIDGKPRGLVWDETQGGNPTGRFFVRFLTTNGFGWENARETDYVSKYEPLEETVTVLLVQRRLAGDD